MRTFNVFRIYFKSGKYSIKGISEDDYIFNYLLYQSINQSIHLNYYSKQFLFILIFIENYIKMWNDIEPGRQIKRQVKD